MKANIKKPPKPPRSWDRLPESERKALTDFCAQTVTEQVNHDEATLQKRWIQLACIVLHNQKDKFDKERCMSFIAGWKRVYRTCERFETGEEIDEYLKREMESIFGKDGYPYEWVDSLER